MSNDAMRKKAEATFGKAFMDAAKPKPLAKNAATAQQTVANQRPIPTYKDGGAITKREMTEARVANRAKMAGYKKGGKPEGKGGLAVMIAIGKTKPVKEKGTGEKYASKSAMAKHEKGESPRERMAEMRMMRKAEGGEVDRYKDKLARKTADIEKDYKIALAKGKNEGVAKAKYEQRMADARDDYAKWTKADRTETRAGEAAAERALSEARRTKGASMEKPKMAIESMEKPKVPTIGSESMVPMGRVSAPKAAAPKRAQAPKARGEERVVKATVKPVPTPAAAPKGAPAAATTDKWALGKGPRLMPGQAAAKDTGGVRMKSALGREFGEWLTGTSPEQLKRKAAVEAQGKRDVAARAAARSAMAAAAPAETPRKITDADWVRALQANNPIERRAVGGAGKTRKGQAPIKKGR